MGKPATNQMKNKRKTFLIYLGNMQDVVTIKSDFAMIRAGILEFYVDFGTEDEQQVACFHHWQYFSQEEFIE